METWRYRTRETNRRRRWNPLNQYSAIAPTLAHPLTYPLSPPPSRQPASLSRRPPSPAFLGSVRSTPPFVPPPSRSRSETSLAPLPWVTPAESFLYHRAEFSLMCQYNLPDTHEMSVTREKRIFVYTLHIRILSFTAILFIIFLQLCYFFCKKNNNKHWMFISVIFKILCLFCTYMYFLCWAKIK